MHFKYRQSVHCCVCVYKCLTLWSPILFKLLSIAFTAATTRQRKWWALFGDILLPRSHKKSDGKQCPARRVLHV